VRKLDEQGREALSQQVLCRGERVLPTRGCGERLSATIFDELAALDQTGVRKARE
jgi:hypothetical protein